MTSENLSASSAWNVDADNNIVNSESTIRTDNDRYILSARNAADSADVSALKFNGTDFWYFRATNENELVIGSEETPGPIDGPLQVVNVRSTTNNLIGTSELVARTSGTAAAGMRTGQFVTLENDAGTDKAAGAFIVIWEDPSDGAEESAVQLRFMTGGATDSYQVDKDGLTFDGTNYFNWPGATSYTPTVVGDSSPGMGTYTAQGGWQIQIGQAGSGLMWCGGVVTWSAHTGSGGLEIELPLAVRAGANTQTAGEVSLSDYTYSAGATPRLLTVPGSARAKLVEDSPGSARADIALDTSADLRFSILYAI